jgi:hypothetical protein
MDEIADFSEGTFPAMDPDQRMPYVPHLQKILRLGMGPCSEQKIDVPSAELFQNRLKQGDMGGVVKIEPEHSYASRRYDAMSMCRIRPNARDLLH